MENNLKNRICFLFMAFVFGLATLFICFRPLEIKGSLNAYADTNVNELIYNGSPYSTVFTNSFNSNSDNLVGEDLLLNGSNFQIENNFRLRNDNWSYYFFSNSFGENTFEWGDTGVTITSRDYHNYLTGYDFTYDNDNGYKVYSYSYSRVNSLTEDDDLEGVVEGSLLYTDSTSTDLTYLGNHTGKPFSVNNQVSYRDTMGFPFVMQYGVKYYFILFFDSFGSYGSSNAGYYRAFELYCNSYFPAVNTVTISSSKLPFNIFYNKQFQGMEDYESNGPDTVKFTYYGVNPENYLYINVYSYKTANAKWNAGGVYNYNRSWFVEPPEFSENQAYQNGFNVGRQQGFNEGIASKQEDVYNNGYSAGQSAGYDEGYNDGYSLNAIQTYERGYEVGFNEGQASEHEYTFLSLLGAVVDAPITALTGMLNFDLLGFNLANFFYALITIAIIIFVVRLVLAK